MRLVLGTMAPIHRPERRDVDRVTLAQQAMSAAHAERLHFLEAAAFGFGFINAKMNPTGSGIQRLVQMHDFGKLVYLDLQKSGSTFVSQFLNETCNLPRVKEIKHGRIGRDYRKYRFYFITIRHPVSQYSSLFRYGLDRKGALYDRLAKQGKASLYQADTTSFNEWLRFMLDFNNASLLGEGFEKIPESYNLGFLSFRYLMLSMAHPVKTALKKPATIDLLQYAKEKSIVDYVIFNERLQEGLVNLAKNVKPEYFDQTRVNEFFSKERKINASTVKADTIKEIDGDVYRLITEKERILLSFYS